MDFTTQPLRPGGGRRSVSLHHPVRAPGIPVRIRRADGQGLPLIEVCRKRVRIPVTTTQDCSKMPSVAVAERGIAAIGRL